MSELMRQKFEAGYSGDGKFPSALARDGEGYLYVSADSAWRAWQEAWKAGIESVKAGGPGAYSDIVSDGGMDPRDRPAKCEVCGGSAVVLAYQNGRTGSHPCPRGCSITAEVSKRGRPPTTGRYATREELVTAVRSDYFGTEATTSEIARLAQVSLGTVLKIIGEAPRGQSNG